MRLLRVIPLETGQAETIRHLSELIETSRIEATPVVVVSTDVGEAIRRASSDAAVVFLGFEPPDEGAETAFVAAMNRLAGDLERVIFVYSAGGMALEV